MVVLGLQVPNPGTLALFPQLWSGGLVNVPGVPGLGVVPRLAATDRYIDCIRLYYTKRKMILCMVHSSSAI